MPRALTREQLEARKEKAERFVRDVLLDPGRAEAIADESLEDYAARRKIEILDNPKGRSIMPRRTVADLEEELQDLQEENAELQEKLDQIMDVIEPEEEDEEEDEGPGDEGEE